MIKLRCAACVAALDSWTESEAQRMRQRDQGPSDSSAHCSIDQGGRSNRGFFFYDPCTCIQYGLLNIHTTSYHKQHSPVFVLIEDWDFAHNEDAMTICTVACRNVLQWWQYMARLFGCLTVRTRSCTSWIGIWEAADVPCAPAPFVLASQCFLL